jgi:hypothetical protein
MKTNAWPIPTILKVNFLFFQTRLKFGSNYTNHFFQRRHATCRRDPPIGWLKSAGFDLNKRHVCYFVKLSRLHKSSAFTLSPIIGYGADFGRFFTEIDFLKSIFLDPVRAPALISYVALLIPFHIYHPIVKMTFTPYVSQVISSRAPDRNAFRSHVADSHSESQFLS